MGIIGIIGIMFPEGYDALHRHTRHVTEIFVSRLCKINALLRFALDREADPSRDHQNKNYI